MKKIVFCVLFFILIPQGYAQLNKVQFEQIDSLQKVEKRNIIVFIHTDWCKYCQTMRNKTFKNETVINLINSKFYFVDFNAEEKREITFNNNKFSFKPNGINSGVHELAIELGTIDKQINYPVLCILNDKNEIIFQSNGFLNAEEVLKIVNQ